MGAVRFSRISFDFDFDFVSDRLNLFFWSKRLNMFYYAYTRGRRRMGERKGESCTPATAPLYLSIYIPLPFPPSSSPA